MSLWITLAVAAAASAVTTTATLFVIWLFESPYGPPPKDPRPWLQRRREVMKERQR